jgi:hypothetical protein
MRFEKNLERSKLRLHFSDGETVEGIIIEVADPDDGDGFVYERLPLTSGSPAIWAQFKNLEKYDVLES